MSTLNFISVIVTTRNRSTLLNNFLFFIQNQTIKYSDYEIIVIDNGSNDKTFTIVENHKKKIPNIRYIYEPMPGLHSGRNRGLSESKGDILVYTDDDTQPFPNWLKEIRESFEKQSNVAIVSGKILPIFETRPPDWIKLMWNKKTLGYQVLGHLSLLDLGNKSIFVSSDYIFGANFSIRRLFLEQAKGFHPDGMPERFAKYRGDGESYVAEYVESQNHKILYNPQASIYHYVSNSRMTIKYFCRHSFNQGISDSYRLTRKNCNVKNEILLSQKRRLQVPEKNIISRIKNSFLEKIYQRTDKKLEIIQSKANEFRQKGLIFHQNEIKKDPHLLQWVLQDDYRNKSIC